MIELVFELSKSSIPFNTNAVRSAHALFVKLKYNSEPPRVRTIELPGSSSSEKPFVAVGTAAAAALRCALASLSSMLPAELSGLGVANGAMWPSNGCCCCC